MKSLKFGLMFLFAAFTTSAFAVNCDDSLRGVVAEQLGVPQSDVKATSRVRWDLGADDVDVQELLMGVEDKFLIKFPDAEYNKLKDTKGDFSVQQLLDIVATRSLACKASKPEEQNSQMSLNRNVKALKESTGEEMTGASSGESSEARANSAQ